MAVTRNMRAPSGITGQVWGASGAVYTVDANGYIANVAAADIGPLVAAGCTVVTGNAADGISPMSLRLLGGRKPDGTVMTGSAGAGVFGVTSTAGTSLFLVGEAAQTNTKTDVAIFEAPVPEGYYPGKDLTLTVNSHYTGGGTVGTKTVGVNAYEIATDGSQGSDICATTTAATMTTAAADAAFTITGAGLVAGDKILFKVTMTLQETGGASAVTGRLNSIRLS